MATPKPHRDRSRGPAARAAARERRAQRAARERLATAAERAYVRLLEGGQR